MADSDRQAAGAWIVAISVMAATFMEVLDTTVVNVSLPHIAGSLSATVDESTWALTSYLVANAVILPLAGWLAGRFGRKRLLLMSVGGFTAASFLCGLAPSLAALIFFRIVQGATGGALQPLSQAVMLEAFPPERRGKAMAFWGLGIVTAPILGPVLGGWLTDSYSWRWVFYVNVPVGALALFMISRNVSDPHYLSAQRRGRVDWTGIGLLTLGIGALQVFLDKGEEDDWFASHFMTTLAIVCAIALVAFLVHELRAGHPVVDLRVFKNRTYSAGILLMTAVGFVLYGSLVLLPIMMQTLLGYPALQAGIALAPRGIGSFIAMPAIGIVLGRVDARRVLAIGVVGGAASLYWFGQLTMSAGYWDFFWPQLFQGVAFACLFVPLTTITMDPIPREQMGNATSIFNLMRNIGGSLGIAVATTWLAREQQVHTNVLGAMIDVFNPRVQAVITQMQSLFLSRGADLATATRQADAALWGMVQRQAAMLSFIDVFRAMALLFIVLLPLLLLMKSPRRGGGPAAMH